MKERLGGFAIDEVARAKLLKVEALERREKAVETHGSCNRRLEHLETVSGLPEENIEDHRRRLTENIDKFSQKADFYRWIITECDTIIESEIEKLREIYEAQKDSGE